MFVDFALGDHIVHGKGRLQWRSFWRFILIFNSLRGYRQPSPSPALADPCRMKIKKYEALFEWIPRRSRDKLGTELRLLAGEARELLYMSRSS